MKTRTIMVWAVFLVILTSAHVHAQLLPTNIAEFTDDYYDAIGEPQLSASVVGNPEYDSGETSTVFIQLMNEGLIFGFETDEEPSNADETMDAREELDLEHDVTTAINIRGTLENEDDEYMGVISGLQQGGSLRSGETSTPMEFEVEVYKNAPAGTYELTLNLTYQYQYDVRVDGNPEPEYDYWYVTKEQTLPIVIKVKQKADFEIVNVSEELVPGGEGVLKITYRNIGNEVAEDAVARISVVDPFSTTDDKAYLGTLNPGDTYEAQYRIKVDKDALPKSYGIDTEVKYRDERGDIEISDVMKASASVSEPLPLTERVDPKLIIAGYVLAFVVILGAAGIFFHRKFKRTKK